MKHFKSHFKIPQWNLKRYLCVSSLVLLPCLANEPNNIPLQPNFMNFDQFYMQVHTQTLARNFVRFRHRVVVSREGYHSLSLKEKEVLNQLHALVLVFSKISWFIYFNEQSGVGISTTTNSHLQFDIRYYETLKDIGIEGDIKAMCVLPYFDKCILLGYRMF